MGSGTGAAKRAVSLGGQYSNVWYSPGAGTAAQTWSARWRISMSTAHDEHLIVGSVLMRSMLASRARPRER